MRDGRERYAEARGARGKSRRDGTPGRTVPDGAVCDHDPGCGQVGGYLAADGARRREPLHELRGGGPPGGVERCDEQVRHRPGSHLGDGPFDGRSGHVVSDLALPGPLLGGEPVGGLLRLQALGEAGGIHVPHAGMGGAVVDRAVSGVRSGELHAYADVGDSRRAGPVDRRRGSGGTLASDDQAARHARLPVQVHGGPGLRAPFPR